MKSLSILLSVLAALSCAPGHADVRMSSSANGNSIASVEAKGDQVVATIRGQSGVVNVQGDRVEVAHGVVFVNGRSYGAVPQPAEIRYVIGKTGRTLFVDQQPRGPSADVKRH